MINVCVFACCRKTRLTRMSRIRRSSRPMDVWTIVTPSLLVYLCANLIVCSLYSQRSCSSVSRCSQIRPRDTAPGGPSLAAGAATHPIQTVRRRLRSASSTDLVMPATRRSTIGDLAFAVLTREHGTVYLLLSASQKDLKSHLFGLSFLL